MNSNGPPQLTPAQWASYGESKRLALYISMGVFLVLGNSTFVARIYCQLERLHVLLLEDAFLAFALILANVGIVLNILATTKGLGLHDYRVIAEDDSAIRGESLVRIYELIYVSNNLQAACLASVKIALLFLYRRIFIVNQKWLKVTWWGNLLFVIALFLIAIFFNIFQCSPINWYWMRMYILAGSPVPNEDLGYCSPASRSVIYATLSLNIVSDVALLLLPAISIATLQITMGNKIGLAVVFGFGIIASVVSLGRLVSLQEGNDATFTIVNYLILSSAEQITAIVCACWPTVVPHLFRFFRRRHNVPTPPAAHRSSRHQPMGLHPSWTDPQLRTKLLHDPLCGLDLDGTGTGPGGIHYLMRDVRAEHKAGGATSPELIANPKRILVKRDVHVEHEVNPEYSQHHSRHYPSSPQTPIDDKRMQDKEWFPATSSRTSQS